MKRIHALLIALMIGLAAVAGTYAATQTAHLGAAAAKQNAATIKQREQRLAAGEAALRKALVQSPAPAATRAPARAAVPAAAPRVTPAAAPAAAPAATPAQRVVYVRPAPIIIHKHRAGGEIETEGTGGGSND